MKISATIHNETHAQEVTVTTNAMAQSISIPVKTTGRGSAVNGGELLFLALATCFCNDVYREAARRQMQIESVEVQVSGEFLQEGGAAQNISYQVHITAGRHTRDEIQSLIIETDRVAEIHNTLRKGARVELIL